MALAFPVLRMERFAWVFVTTVFQVHFYDMVISYTSFFQMLTEEINHLLFLRKYAIFANTHLSNLCNIKHR